MLHVPVEKESLIAMKKSKVTRSLLAACSIVALSAVMYGCTHSGDDGPTAAELSAEQERAEEAKQAQEKAEQAQMDLDAAITAEASARMAVADLSATSTDAEVMDAQTKLAAAQAAVMKLAEDHALRTSVAQLATDLQGVETARTVASQLMAVNNAHDMAKMAVDELDRAGSTAEAVAEARTKVDDAQAALNAATALSEEQRTSLSSMIMAVDGTLDGIEAYRATDAGQLAVAEAAVDAAEGLVDALTDESTPAEAGAAYAALQRATQAVAAAEDLPDNVRTRLNAKINELQKQATGQSSITLALAEATTAVNSLNADSTDADVAAARTKVAAAVTAAAELPDDDARKMAIAALDKNLMGIEQARTDEGNKPGLDANAMALVAVIDGEALPTMPNSTTIADGKPQLTGDDKYAASTMSIDSIDGWMGSTFMRMNKAVLDDLNTKFDESVGASEDAVVVYNNKGPDVAVGYLSHMFAGGADPDDNTGVVTLVPASETGVIGDTITLGGSGSVRTITASGSAGDELDGTFHGLGGKFACASGCTINVLSDGKLQTEATDLTFTPTTDTSDSDDAPNIAHQLAALTVMIADPDYMHFGYWKNASMNKKGEPVYMVSAFSGGTMPSPVASGTPNGVQELEGSAKYAGSATGLYVRKEVDSGGDPQHLYHGQFTANAALTAYFGGNDVALSKQYTVDGMITNFMDGDDAIDSTWSVTLNAALFGANSVVASGYTTPLTDAERVFEGTTEGDKGMMGNWMGQFFGDVTITDETVYPSGVAGQFNGHFVNGHALGAFGADMMDE